MNDDERRQTHFGFRDVAEDEKAGLVHGVFSRVASKYDVMNDLMSVGVHRLWKTAMMDWLAPRNGQRLLDVAGGTGDIAFRFLDRAPGGHVTVCDMTESMLVEGRQRAEAGRDALENRVVGGELRAVLLAHRKHHHVGGRRGGGVLGDRAGGDRQLGVRLHVPGGE